MSLIKLFSIICFLILTLSGGMIEEVVKADLPYLVDFYKERHRNPEISLQEKETSEILAQALEEVGYDVTREFGGYGIVGIYKNGEGPLILYRTDMDALPMVEKTELDYASNKEIEYAGRTTGAMHSCGHDMHMTVWLGTARAMVKMKDQWQGTLMMIGQPAEEIGAGSKLMLDAGLYQQFGVPEYGIGLHCSPIIQAGKIGLESGYSMANVESIDIKVFGIGSHGASPHMSIDPVVISSMIIMELQTIVSRTIKPIDDAVITVGAINGGTQHNIIPDEVTLKLTVRTYTEKVRLRIHQRIKEICKGVAIAAGLPEDKYPDVTIPEVFTPANYNNQELVDKIRSSAAKILGNSNVIAAEPQMIGEDFSRYGSTKEQVPTVLYWLGTVPEMKILAEESLPGLHSPFYYPELEASIETGVKSMGQILIDLMN